MRRNRLRELLDAGQPTLGTHLHISWPSIVELVGHSKMFDYVEFVAEYAPYDLYALENIGRAIDLFDHLSGMMKIEQDPRTYLTIRADRFGHSESCCLPIRERSRTSKPACGPCGPNRPIAAACTASACGGTWASSSNRERPPS